MLMDYGEEFFADLEIAGYLQAYGRFLKDYNPKWEYIEIMGNAERDDFKFAGTIDRIGYIGDDLVILDIKTGQLHDALITAQLTAYGILATRTLNDICGRFKYRAWNFNFYGLKLSKDGTYILKKYEPDGELLDSAIYIYNVTHRRNK